MIPKLNQNIYVLFTNCWDESYINQETVIALGEDIFFHSGCTDISNTEEYRIPLAYDEYGITWFTSMKQIKEKYKVKKNDDYSWEVISKC